MEKIRLGASNLEVPRLAVGCMRMDGADEKKATELLHTALDMGFNYFDHADFYGYWNNYVGICEELFAKYLPMTPSMREKIILQTKCGVKIGDNGKGGMMNIGYDFSKDYILNCVDAALKRLNTDDDFSGIHGSDYTWFYKPHPSLNAGGTIAEFKKAFPDMIEISAQIPFELFALAGLRPTYVTGFSSSAFYPWNKDEILYMVLRGPHDIYRHFLKRIRHLDDHQFLSWSQAEGPVEKQD